MPRNRARVCQTTTDKDSNDSNSCSMEDCPADSDIANMSLSQIISAMMERNDVIKDPIMGKYINALLLLDTHNPDLVFITETWLSSKVSDAEILCGRPYNVYRIDRDSRRGGG
ncbi:hypothetical protein OSTOST_25621, partial [Ostertagia ostertagi]